MAQTISHARSAQSTNSKRPTLSRKARERAAVLGRLAADLRLSCRSDFDGTDRITATLMLLINDDPEELTPEELEHARRLRVPAALRVSSAR